MRKALLAVLLLTSAALAQLQVYTIPASGVEEPLSDFFEVSETPAGSAIDTRIRIRNPGEATIPVERLRMTGQGFSLRGHPTTPIFAAPGSNIDFRVRFQPLGPGSYSGTLRINDSLTMFFGSSPAAVSVLVQDGGAFRPVAFEETIILGRVEYAATSSRRFRLENSSRQELTVAQLETDSPAFILQGAPKAPFSMAPGVRFDFEILYAPTTAGIHRAVLLVNGVGHALEGVALQPPFPRPEIRLDAQAASSGQQRSLSVHLAEPSPVAGSGRIRMEFVPALETVLDDPAVLFASSGARTIPLTVEDGAQSALLDGLESAAFQTGTTAGTIRFFVELGVHVETASLSIPGAPVEIDSSNRLLTPTGIQLDIAGFDNTRTVSEVAFTFFDVSGKALTGEPIRLDVRSAFQEYFVHAGLGGVFSLRAAFPVAGDVSLVESAEVRFLNTAGPSQVRRIDIN